MAVTHYLITDPAGTCAERVEQATGLCCHDTHLGILVEKPEPFDLHGAMAIIERAFHPIRCSCGHTAIVHMPPCPLSYGIT